jgi:two-component system, OmpR family, sensor histidine kinase QseC
MSSLRGRLLVALLALIFSVWAGWLWCQTIQATRQQTGVWDRSLESIAAQVLLSMPGNLSEYSPRRGFELPRDMTMKAEKLSFQVWLHDGHRKVIGSAFAPPTAMKPDFRDGFATVEVGGVAWRVHALSDSRGQIQVHVGKPVSELKAELRSWIRVTLATALGSFLVLAIAIKTIIHWSLKPVQAVQKTIETRHPLDLEPLPEKNLLQEFRPLVSSFNALLKQLDGALQTERRFIADAAHELRTPLAALGAHAQLALNAADVRAEKTALNRLVEVVQRSTRLSEQLLDMARLDSRKVSGSFERVNLHELVVVVARDFEAVAAQREQTIFLETDACEVNGNVDDLGILARNLIDNALRYAGAGARIAIACREGLLRVADNGPGVREDERQRIFNRFYRPAGTGGRGSGIGLSLVSRIAQMHGATIQVADGLEGRGLTVSVRFPAPA